MQARESKKRIPASTAVSCFIRRGANTHAQDSLQMSLIVDMLEVLDRYCSNRIKLHSETWHTQIKVLQDHVKGDHLRRLRASVITMSRSAGVNKTQWSSHGVTGFQRAAIGDILVLRPPRFAAVEGCSKMTIAHWKWTPLAATAIFSASPDRQRLHASSGH